MPQEFLHFLTAHYLLTLAFIVILLAIFFEELKSKSSGNNLTPADATHLINRENAVVVDIREREGFNTGHIVNSINIPQKDLLTSEKLKKLQAKPIILVCKLGQTSLPLASKLRKQGFKTVCVLKGGIDAWKNAGLPLSK